MAVNPLDRVNPVVNDQGVPLQNLNQFSEAVARLDPLSGIGSPEGNVDGAFKQRYIRLDGPPWEYVKIANDVTGNRKNGWKATNE